MENEDNVILSAKQERFCQEYINCLNATQAAIVAGYSEATARQQAAQNMSKLYILKRIKQLQQETCEKLNITRDTILRKYKEIYDIEPDGFIYKNSDRLKALELTAKMLGLNEPEKIEHSGYIGVNIEVKSEQIKNDLQEVFEKGI